METLQQAAVPPGLDRGDDGARLLLQESYGFGRLGLKRYFQVECVSSVICLACFFQQNIKKHTICPQKTIGSVDVQYVFFCGCLTQWTSNRLLQAIRPDRWMAISSRAQRLISTNGPEMLWCNGTSPVSTSTVPWQDGAAGQYVLVIENNHAFK